MTRGRRRNNITVSGPVKALRNDEIEIKGSASVFMDDLRARGSISAAQHGAATSLLRDIAARNERADRAMASVSPLSRNHIETILVSNTKLIDYGREVQGFKDDTKCYAWALAALRSALDGIASFYSKHVYGEVEDEG